MKTQVNNQTKIADERKLLLLGETTTKLARTASTWGIETGALNRSSMLEILICFGLYFMSPKWTRTRLVIVISPSLQA